MTYLPPKLSYTICWISSLIISSLLFFSCSHQSLPFDKACMLAGNGVTTSTATGHYYRVMKMTQKDYLQFIKPKTFKRFIFQFRNVSKDGHDEFEIDSYAWYKGVFIKDSLRHKMFLEKATDAQLILLEPGESYAYSNVELRRPDAKEQHFDTANAIYLVPFFDKCRKTINIRMVRDIDYPLISNGSKQKGTGPPLVDLPELYLNPCPPDIPRGH